MQKQIGSRLQYRETNHRINKGVESIFEWTEERTVARTRWPQIGHLLKFIEEIVTNIQNKLIFDIKVLMKVFSQYSKPMGI